MDVDNRSWLIERQGRDLTPEQARRQHEEPLLTA
jgi:hypothetical protein